MKLTSILILMETQLRQIEEVAKTQEVATQAKHKYTVHVQDHRHNIISTYWNVPANSRLEAKSKVMRKLRFKTEVVASR